MNARASDPEANTKVGRFLCLYKGDWKAGLPHLVAGNDKALAALATAELAAPSEADAQLKLADSWWDAGQSGTAVVKLQTQRHALEFYKAALPRLTGLGKVQAEKRIAEAEATPGVAPRGGLAKGEEVDIAAKILAKIPKELLPTKEDPQADVRKKSSKVRTWMDNNRMIGSSGTTLTMAMSLKHVSLSTASSKNKRVVMFFEALTTFQGIECRTELLLHRAVTGEDDEAYKQAKQLESDGKEVVYTVTAPVNSLNVNFGKPSDEDVPHATIHMDSMRGAYSVKARPKGP